MMLILLALFPVLCAPAAYAMGKKGKAILAMILATLIELAGILTVSLTGEQTLVLPGAAGMGMRMAVDGFRGLYASIACVMWLVTSIFSRDYLKHDHAPGRYAFFTLLTQGATVGLFLSDSLYTAFVFFEVMSMASYPWVAHEEDKSAMRAAQTYLYIAVIGGLVMLMGILMLPGEMATASFENVEGGAAAWLPAALILVGFGAKAGAFPIHIWLPKAHPVAPAPASALLSGMLTKAGVFGMLVLTCRVMRGVDSFGNMIFLLGVVTMFLGALLAIFSTNLKRTLACSSLSQIGFIMVGVGVQGLCHGENGLAAFGTIQHMMNHSLFKLVLFLVAGVVAMNAKALDLNEVRGFGRKKPVLHFCYLMAMLGIAGIPGWSGYHSKSLLHEGLLEYIHELTAHGHAAGLYQFCEIVFIISGGMTLCYMTKLYVCLFWQKNPTRQKEYDGMKRYMSLPSAVALSLCAAVVPVLGLFPDVFMTGVGRLAQPFFAAADPHHMPVPYFSAENLIGAAKSIAVGIVLFFVQWKLVMHKGAYPDRWPKKLDLEESVYRPLLSALIAMGSLAATLADLLPNWLIEALRGLGGGIAKAADVIPDFARRALEKSGAFIARLLGVSGDAAVYGVRRLFLPRVKEKQPVLVGNRITYALGRLMDRVRPTGKAYESVLAALRDEVSTDFKRVTKSVSFGLFMFCLGLAVTLIFLLLL